MLSPKYQRDKNRSSTHADPVLPDVYIYTDHHMHLRDAPAINRRGGTTGSTASRKGLHIHPSNPQVSSTPPLGSTCQPAEKTSEASRASRTSCSTTSASCSTRQTTEETSQTSCASCSAASTSCAACQSTKKTSETSSAASSATSRTSGSSSRFTSRSSRASSRSPRRKYQHCSPTKQRSPECFEKDNSAAKK